MAGLTTDADALKQRLLDASVRYAPWLTRKGARQAVANGCLPRFRSESWRHTNVAHWYREVLGAGECRDERSDGITTAGDAEAVDFASPGAAELACRHVGGTFAWDAQPLAAVNRLLLDAGTVVRVRGTARQTVAIGDLGGAFQHVLVLVDAGADVVLSEAPSRYLHRIVEIVIADGGQVEHRRRQGAGSEHQCSLLSVKVERHGQYTLAQSCVGAKLRRNDTVVALAEGAQAKVASAWRLGGQEHLDNQVSINHLEPNANSRQVYRGVASDRAMAILNGRIHIAPGADGSDAALTSKNLLASDRAQVFARPVLEIHASDVKCSHGAAVGALDEAAIHYLRCRGIGEPAARDLLMRGFLREAVDDADGESLLGIAP